MTLEGIQTGINFESLDKLPGVSNYFIGNDKSKWHRNIPQYSKVIAREIYPGVDMIYYGNQRHLEYDIMVKPGADPNSIHLKYEGAKSGKINDQGDLELELGGGKVTFRSPQAYQETDGRRAGVEGRYNLEADGGIHFEVGNYDKTKPLVIDPELDYSTYLGANTGEGGQGIAVDENGDACLTGGTSSSNFPTTSGAYQASDPATGYSHAFVSELNPAGTALVFSTYLGGNNEDEGYGIATDLNGNVYVTGGTGSNDFPTTPGAYQASGGAFITELNSTGNLVYSTCLGTNDQGIGIALGSNGNIYVVGDTNSSSFSTTSGAFQASAPPDSGDGWAFVSELDPTGSGSAQLTYSTYLGGNDDDQGNGIALDSNGNIYVTGSTYSTNFPTTSSAF
ncbi:MAG TPA: SBBP repeat-containing protein, partial [bacterium]|nr:SBBP repeat-containing protein [bacterium]